MQAGASYQSLITKILSKNDEFFYHFFPFQLKILPKKNFFPDFKGKKTAQKHLKITKKRL